MGYFSETMALFETKGDVNAAFALRNLSNSDTGLHNGAGKKASKHGNTSNWSDTPMKTADDYRKRNDYANAVASGAEIKRERQRKHGLEYNKDCGKIRQRDIKRDRDAYASYTYKESFSEAFNSVIL